MRVLVIMRLGETKARDKVIPLLQSQAVEQLTLVRHAPLDLSSPKLTQLIHNAGLPPDGEKGSALASLRNVAACLWNGLRAARHDRSDAVIAFNLVPYGVIAWIIARLTGSAAVVSLIGTDFDVWVKRSLLRLPLRALLRQMDVVSVVSESARNTLASYGVGPERIAVLPNTTDTSQFKAHRAAEPDTDLIYVGYLRGPKRIELILLTLKEIHRRRPYTNLLVVGDGPDRERLESVASSLGLDDYVRFHGHSTDVWEQLARARVFISLSEREGLPMAMIEAMCAGLPVVVTDVGAISTVVEDGSNGYLVPSPADPVFVAERVLRFLNNPQQRKNASEAARAECERHGYAAAAATWDSILSHLPRR